MKDLIKMIGKKYPGKHNNLTCPSGFSIITSKSFYYLNLNYRRHKRSGEFMQKEFQLPIVMVYCPICGEKYE